MVEEETIERKIPADEKIRVLKLPFKLPSKLTELLDGFKWAIHLKNQSAVIVVDGRSGMGKTTLSSQIGAYVSKDFNLSCLHFTPESFLDGLTRVKKGDVIVFDEAMLLSSRAALSTINRMIVIAMSMIRSKNILVIFNVNSIFDLDRNLALSRADLLLNVYGDSLTDKGKFLAFFKGGDGLDRIKMLYIYGKKYYSYSQPKSNFNSTFSGYFALDEQEYERLKQEGVNRFLKGQKKAQTSRYLTQRNILLSIVSEIKGLTLRELEDFLKSKGINIGYTGISKAISKSIEENEKKNNTSKIETEDI